MNTKPSQHVPQYAFLFPTWFGVRADGIRRFHFQLDSSARRVAHPRNSSDRLIRSRILRIVVVIDPINNARHRRKRLFSSLTLYIVQFDCIVKDNTACRRYTRAPLGFDVLRYSIQDFKYSEFIFYFSGFLRRGVVNRKCGRTNCLKSSSSTGLLRKRRSDASVWFVPVVAQVLVARQHADKLVIVGWKSRWDRRNFASVILNSIAVRPLVTLAHYIGSQLLI